MTIEYKDSWVYLVDDDPAIRDSLTVLLESTGLKIASFDSAADFLNDYRADRPSCLVLDVKMPLMNGLELQEELYKQKIQIPIIFISGNAEIPDAAKAFKGGAVDFIEKPFNPNQLISCVLNALKKDIADREQRLEQERIFELFGSLSAREKEVLLLIINNYTSKEAAQKLDISYRTVEAHRANIMEKLQAKSSTDLVSMALKYSLLT